MHASDDVSKQSTTPVGWSHNNQQSMDYTFTFRPKGHTICGHKEESVDDKVAFKLVYLSVKLWTSVSNKLSKLGWSLISLPQRLLKGTCEMFALPSSCSEMVNCTRSSRDWVSTVEVRLLQNLSFRQLHSLHFVVDEGELVVKQKTTSSKSDEKYKNTLHNILWCGERGSKRGQ